MGTGTVAGVWDFLTSDPQRLTVNQCGLDHITVLHVDDDPDFCALTAQFLEREGESLSVTTATDARIGLERFAEGDIDCIVSDYEMPGMNGLEFLEEVREQDSLVPFVLFTGKGSETIASEAIARGVTDYLQKRTGTDQYTVLANRIDNAVTHYYTQLVLREREARLRQIFEHSNDGIMVIDPNEDEILEVNPKVATMLGYTREELLALSPSDIHPGEIQQFRAFMETVSEEESGWTDNLTCRTKSGGRLPVEISASVIIPDESPNVLGIIRDVSGQDRPSTRATSCTVDE